MLSLCGNTGAYHFITLHPCCMYMAVHTCIPQVLGIVPLVMSTASGIMHCIMQIKKCCTCSLTRQCIDQHKLVFAHALIITLNGWVQVLLRTNRGSPEYHDSNNEHSEDNENSTSLASGETFVSFSHYVRLSIVSSCQCLINADFPSYNFNDFGRNFMWEYIMS